jgi:hypothetical protein
MSLIKSKTELFREKLADLSREDLLEVIKAQSPDILFDIERIEWVFKNKLKHLTWEDGTPIEGRDFSKEDLALLIDEPFEVDTELSKMGLSVEQQKQLHIASDPVTWSKSFLNAKPRAYQILMLRHPSKYKVLRAGRRLGKTWTMAVLLLHYSFTTKNGRSLVLTPMLAQAKLIFEEMMKLANEAPVVRSSIIRNVLNPNPEIMMSNGSTIRFFTSGMKSGGKSDVTRGQEAHLIVLDEVDYMGDEDLEAIFAMLQQTTKVQAEKRLIGASTPTGRHAMFYDWCTDKDSVFKEFWFPSYCNPFWDQETEDFLRSSNSEMGYRHEVEADWGEDADGVYPRRHVDAAFFSARQQYPEAEFEFVRKHSTWKYVPEATDPDSTYIIGVDWDKYGAGTNIVVLEMFGNKHPDTFKRGKLKLCYRTEIIKEEYLLKVAVNKIIELNRRFNPKWIYVDRGFGEMQIEELHSYGVENPSTGLHKKVVGISSAQTLEVRDPHTRQIVKKDIKPFMVDNLRQMLENQVIFFSSDDEDLYEQFIHYIVARTTSTGRPVFEMSSNKPDHIHDALILACLAVTQNYGELLRVRYAKGIKVISNEAFLPMFQLSDNESEREGEEILVRQVWGKPSAAPVAAKRAFTYNVRSSKKPIKRRSF